MSYLSDYLNGVFSVYDPRLAEVGGSAFKKTIFKTNVIPTSTPCKIYMPNICFFVS